MNKYIAVLRGINVSGQKKIIMADLKCLVESLEFSDVSTYIQSGNIVFQSAITHKIEIKACLENAIEQKYGFYVPVEIRSAQELHQILNELPFEHINVEQEGTKVLVTFLSAIPTKGDIDKLLGYVVEPEKLVVNDQTVYLHCPNGYGRSKLSNVFIEKKLQVSATTRNLKTVVKLCQLLVDD